MVAHSAVISLCTLAPDISLTAAASKTRHVTADLCPLKANNTKIVITIGTIVLM